MSEEFKIKSITIDHTLSIIRVTRSYYIDGESYISPLYIPEEIEGANNVEVKDSVANGTLILYPHKSSFPQHLDLYKNQRFKIQMVEGSQITGKYISKSAKLVVVDVESFHSYKLATTIPKGLISLNQDHILSYFPIDEVNQDDGNNTNNLTKIVIKNTSTPREIQVTYNLSNVSIGKITHSIKGIKSEPLYTDPDLDSDIPITITTEYHWTPIWNITNSLGNIRNSSYDDDFLSPKIVGHDNNDSVTLNIILLDGKQTYTVENLICFKNYENKIQINEFETTCTRASLVYPMGPIEIALYFKNNSKVSLTDAPISFIDDGINLSNKSQTGFSFGDKKDETPTQKQTPTLAAPVEGNGFAFGVRVVKESYKFLETVKANSIGIIIFTGIPNHKIKIYKDIAHQPLYETRSREFDITEIKLSTIFTLMDAQILNKIKYQFVNATQFNVKYIVYLGINGLGFNPNENIHINENKDCEKIGDLLYLFESSPLSINSFEIKYSDTKQLMTHSKLPQVVINYLNEKGIAIKYNPDKFQTFDLSSLDRNTMDTLLKLMNTLLIEEKKSNYFNRAFNLSVGGLFGMNTNNFGTNQQQTGFGRFGTNNNIFGTNNNTFGQPSAFGQQTTSPFGTHSNNTFGYVTPQPATTTSLFGSTSTTGSLFGSASTPVTTGFGSAPSTDELSGSIPTTGGLFGASLPPLESSASITSTTGGLFGSSQSLSSQPTPQPPPSLFGSTPASTTSFGFGSTPASTTTSASPTSFGFGSTPSSTTSFGFGSTKPTSSTTGGFFGASSTPTPSTTTFGSSQPTPQPPSTIFGSPPTHTSSFSFGTPSPSPSPTATTTSAFSFGNQTQITPSFSFGAPEPGNQTGNPDSYKPTQLDGNLITSISAMPEFSNKSVEEIRNEQIKNK